MNWIKTVENYRPISMQEVKDREVILKYNDTFNNLLTRENEFAHITASAFAVNEDLDKFLMIYHNIYDTWAWTGGHADGLEDMYEVACKELLEETGITKIKPLTKNLISLDIIPVFGHVKRDNYVSGHLHINLTYALICDESEELVINVEENSGVKWVPFDQIEEHSNEKELIEIYNKIIDRIKTIKIKNG